MYSKDGFYYTKSIERGDIKKIALSIADREPVQIHLRMNTEVIDGITYRFQHAVLANRVRMFDNGKFIINVMNPVRGGVSRFTNTNIFSLVFSIIKR